MFVDDSPNCEFHQRTDFLIHLNLYVTNKFQLICTFQFLNRLPHGLVELLKDMATKIYFYNIFIMC